MISLYLMAQTRHLPMGLPGTGQAPSKYWILVNISHHHGYFYLGILSPFYSLETKSQHAWHARDKW